MEFALEVVDLGGTLDKTPTGTHDSGQLLRCATSAAPNYAKARGAESGNDFIHRLGIMFNELNE